MMKASYHQIEARLGVDLAYWSESRFGPSVMWGEETRAKVALGHIPCPGQLFIGKVRLIDLDDEGLLEAMRMRNAYLEEVAPQLHSLYSRMDEETRSYARGATGEHLMKRRREGERYIHHKLMHTLYGLGDVPSDCELMDHFIPSPEVLRAAWQFPKEDRPVVTMDRPTTDDMTKWRHFVTKSTTGFNSYLKRPLNASLPFSELKSHAYVLGATNAGKTELLKSMVHHIIANEMSRDPMVGGLLIDPNGDFSKEVMRFKESVGNDRVVVFDPTLKPDHTPCLNIFEPAGFDESSIEIASEELLGAFEEIIADSTITANMRALLKPCLAVLLRRSGSSMADLQRFMLDEHNADLVALGCKAPIPGQADFFAQGFGNKRYDATKTAIYTRLQTLQNSLLFTRLINPKATFSLDKALGSGKFIVMNLSKGAMSESVSSAFGRLVLAQVKAAAYRRAPIPVHLRSPNFIFVDECQNFISESIETAMTELRKFGVGLILANQVLGQNMSAQLTKVVLGNPAIKFSGKNGQATNSVIAREMGIDIEQLNELDQGQFAVHLKGKRSYRSFVVSAPTHCLGMRNAAEKEKWLAALERGWEPYLENSVLDAAFESSHMGPEDPGPVPPSASPEPSSQGTETGFKPRFGV